MLNVSNLSIHFANRYLFDNVTFTVDNANRIALIGRNGSGKTTLLKIIAGEITPEEGKIIKSNDYKVGYLPQDGNLQSDLNIFDEAKKALSEILDLEAQIKAINEEIASRTDYESTEYSKLIQKLSDINHRFEIIGGYNYEAQIEKILTGLGFEREDFFRKVNEFSGGWRMRLALAKILLSAPDCIMLDEPTNHLDIESIIWLESFLKNYFGAVILVSHDRRFLDSVTNRTIEISNGKTIDFPLPYSKFLVYREEIREQQMNAYKNQQKQIEKTEKYIEAYRYKATLASRVQSKIKQLEKIERIEIDEVDNSAIHLKFPKAPPSGRTALEIENLTKYYDDKLILKDINFSLDRGEKVAFIGKNGEGKTTLTKIIANETYYEGVCKLGHNVSLAYFSQHQADLLDKDSTVFQIIDNAATGEMRTKVRSVLGAFLFSGDAVDKKVKVLSGGERSRLALAKLLLQSHNFLILDEPTNHLDITSKEVLKKALIDYDGTLILVSHDRDFLEGITNKTVHFKNKQIKEYLGDINYFLEKQELEHLREVEKNSQTQKLESDQKEENRKRYEQNKEQQRKINSLKKKVTQAEERIHKLEEEIEAINEQFALPEVIADYKRADELQKELDKKNAELEQELSSWESYNLELDELS